MSTLSGSATLALGSLFLVAGLAKLLTARKFRTALVLSGMIPERALRFIGIVVPTTEIGAGSLLVTRLWHPAGPVLALALLTVFTVRAWPVAMAERTGGSIRCGCFGAAGDNLGPELIVRNFVLFVYGVAGLAGASAAVGEAVPVRVVVTAGLIAAPFALAEIAGVWYGVERLGRSPALSGATWGTGVR